MPIEWYIGGPTFGGESCQRDVAFYENTLAIKAAEAPMRAFADMRKAQEDGDRPSLAWAFHQNAETTDAIHKVHKTLMLALPLNQYKDEEQYNTLLERARQWNQVFPYLCLATIPLPEEKAAPAPARQYEPATAQEAKPSLMRRAIALLPRF